jgi:hypothetical protein
VEALRGSATQRVTQAKLVCGRTLAPLARDDPTAYARRSEVSESALEEHLSKNWAGYMVYISITGLRLKRFYHAPVFWWYAVRAMVQAKSAPGNISADARTINGVHHTLTVWTDPAAMRRYLTSGAHGQAMRQFDSIATGKTLGYLAQSPPRWDEVHEIWLTRGRDYRTAR